MRIDQAYVSKSIQDFPFHEIYQLNDYNNINSPCVFIGCYRYEDKVLISNHSGRKIILWTGQDAIDYDLSFTGINSAEHVTAHPKIYDLLVSKGLSVKLINPSSCLNKKNPQQLGAKIYAYCPSSAKKYHGIELIDELRCGGYDIVIGDGRHTQQEWKYIREGYYNEAFIGLCLSDFAGGAGSVIEMGLRGMTVVTNVLNLPNCKPYKSVEDIAYLIEQEKVRIGTVNDSLADQVWNSLDHNYEWLNI